MEECQIVLSNTHKYILSDSSFSDPFNKSRVHNISNGGGMDSCCVLLNLTVEFVVGPVSFLYFFH